MTTSNRVSDSARFHAYRLPSGAIVNVDATAAKGAPTIPYTLAGGAVVTAVRVVRVRDLPDIFVAVGDVITARPFLRCPECGEACSANRSDYFMCDPDDPLTCNHGDSDTPPEDCTPMQLVTRRTVYEPWTR